MLLNVAFAVWFGRRIFFLCLGNVGVKEREGGLVKDGCVCRKVDNRKVKYYIKNIFI